MGYAQEDACVTDGEGLLATALPVVTANANGS